MNQSDFKKAGKDSEIYPSVGDFPDFPGVCIAQRLSNSQLWCQQEANERTTRQIARDGESDCASVILVWSV